MIKKLLITAALTATILIPVLRVEAGGCGVSSFRSSHIVNNRHIVNKFNNHHNNRFFVDQNVYDNRFRGKFVDRYDVIQKRVEFDSDYFLGLNGYYDVVNELQAREVTRDNDILLKQQEQTDKLINLLEEVLRKQGTLQSKPIVEQEKEEPKPEKPMREVDPLEGVDLNQRVFQIFTDSCAGCHGQESPKAGLQLVGEDPDGTKWLNGLSLSERILVYDSVAGIGLKERGKKLMPLGGQPLSDEDVEVLRLWMIKKAEDSRKGGK